MNQKQIYLTLKQMVLFKNLEREQPRTWFYAFRIFTKNVKTESVNKVISLLRVIATHKITIMLWPR